MTVTKEKIYEILETAMEIEPGSLANGNLSNFKEWDSMSTVSFIALVDEQLQLRVPPKLLFQCVTVDDIVELVQNSSSSNN